MTGVDDNGSDHNDEAKGSVSSGSSTSTWMGGDADAAGEIPEEIRALCPRILCLTTRDQVSADRRVSLADTESAFHIQSEAA